MKTWNKLVILAAAAMGMSVPRQEIEQVVEALR